MKLIVFLLFAFVGCGSAKVSYEGHQVWSIHHGGDKSNEHLLKQLMNLNVDVFAAKKLSVDVRIAPENQSDVEFLLRQTALTYDVKIKNLQPYIEQEQIKIASQPRGYSPNQYNTFEDIEIYLQQLSNNYSMASLTTIGQTYEGRDQWQMQITTGQPDKQIVWIDCGIHAREWITVANCMYGIDILLNQYGIDDDITSLLDRYDFYIIPVYNADGYSYTWTEDRLWRKNRSPNPDSDCYGTDLNRNFNTNWGFSGTSTRPCTSQYGGSGPASELETQNTQAALESLASRMAAMYSFHSYSQFWMYAYAYDYILSADEEALNACGTVGADALQAVHGTEYEVGPWATVLYLSSGTTLDYAYSRGVTYSYTVELRDTGEYGFELPEDQIQPTVEETWAGLTAALLCIP